MGKKGVLNTVPLTYKFMDTQVGRILAATTDKGVVWLQFSCDSDQETYNNLQNYFPNSFLRQGDHKFFNEIATAKEFTEIRVDVNATQFRMDVWSCLRTTKRGEQLTYSQLAQQAGYPKAARAVGSAMAGNPVALLIPCHRVVKKGGEIGNYGGGTELKRELLRWESS